MSREQRLLRISFATPEDFQAEYATNLINGGAFVPTDEPCELREAVSIQLSIDFYDDSLTLAGEVVHCIPPDIAAAGVVPGVAIQFSGTPSEIRKQLEPLLRATGNLEPEAPLLGGRDSLRVTARVTVRIDGGDEIIDGRTRNLSKSGVLIDVFGQGLPVGRRVSVTLQHSTTGETMSVDGTVARHIHSEGDVAAVAVQFDPAAEDREAVGAFIESLQQTEHSRHLGGICGPLSELPPPALLSMFGNAAREGTLIFRRGEEQGMLGFSCGLINFARIGSASGMKALIRMLCWTSGEFEFHARLDPSQSPDLPLPFEGALLDAMAQLDELRELDETRYPGDSVPRVGPASDDLDQPSKLEEAVLDLARAGFSVRRILDVIPESDPQIYKALASLIDRGALDFDAN